MSRACTCSKSRSPGGPVPTTIPLDEIVIYTPGAPANGHSPIQPIGPRPLMLSEAILRAIADFNAGSCPRIDIRGTIHTDSEFFFAVYARSDFPR